jgi:hypothetical protein
MAGASLVTIDLADVLSEVQRPGDFYAAGSIPLAAPRLEVEGVGVIALPLLDSQAGRLVEVAAPAPFGRGAKTLVDRSIRRTWQIAAEKVRLEGRGWSLTLEAIVARVAEGLGVSGPVEAELYKLLVYDEGGFFAPHRDTEKSPGMFATLVVAFPSACDGGELIVRHKDREVRLDLRPGDPSEAVFAAFYADCVHEVAPVASGFRLVLIYNLVRSYGGRPPAPPDHEVELGRACAVLEAWRDGFRTYREMTPEEIERIEAFDEEEDDPFEGKEEGEEDEADGGRTPPWPPIKVVYPLEHAYTPAELSFAALKGADAARAEVMVRAAWRSGFALHLALLTIGESGAAEHTGDWGGHRRWSDEGDDDEFEAGEVFDRWLSLSDWRAADGGASPPAELPVDDMEISPPEAFEELAPDEERFREATGNEGASFERTYRRAALVLWPVEETSSVLCQGGLEVTLPYLDDMADRSDLGSGAAAALLREQAHDLAMAMVARWPRARGSDFHGGDPHALSRVLAALARLSDNVATEAFLQSVTAAGEHDKRDNESIVEALARLPAERAGAVVLDTMVHSAPRRPEACADLLARIARSPRLRAMPGLTASAAQFVDSLPGDPKLPPEPRPWEKPPRCGPDLVVDFVNGLDAIDPALSTRAVEHALAWRGLFDLDSVLTPAARRLVGSGAAAGSRAAERLRQACVAHLEARVAEPLTPPPDWRRASDIECGCADCADLAGFLADPVKSNWVFKAAEPRRRHVEDSIRRARPDLDTRTERRGSPHSLIGVKNQASYERRARQRTDDLATLAELTRESATAIDGIA